VALSNLARSVVEFTADRALLVSEDRILVALSGGADSCALLLALVEAGREGLLPMPVGVAHFHHGMRGRDADADAGFCAQLAVRVGLPCVIGLGALAHANEADARTVRYAFLTEAAQELGASVVATAHHADDLAETVLLRVLRGTSVEGLAGIPPRRALGEGIEVVRPLLGCRRTEIEAYCQQQGILPRHDPTNDNPLYPRSRVRQLLPELAAQFNPRLTEALVRLAESASADTAALQPAAEALWAESERAMEPLVLQCAPLLAAPAALRRRVLYRALWSATEAEREARVTARWIGRLEALLTTPGQLDLPGRVRATSDAQALLLGPPLAPVPLGGRLVTRLGAPLTTRSRRSLLIDCGTIPANLRVRGAADGDRIAPLGMGGKTRLVRDLLREAGVGVGARSGWPLVVDAADTVLWVVGVAQAEQTRVPQQATSVLILEWEQEGKA